MAEQDRFNADNGKYQLRVKTGGIMGGVASGESRRLVVCDYDFQPHYENAHPPDEYGNAHDCINPLKWTKKGVQMKDEDLEF